MVVLRQSRERHGLTFTASAVGKQVKAERTIYKVVPFDTGTLQIRAEGQARTGHRHRGPFELQLGPGMWQSERSWGRVTRHLGCVWHQV